MDITEYVYFTSIPDYRTILAEIINLSGLKEICYNEQYHQLEHPLFQKRAFSIHRDSKGISLNRGWPEKWYLYDVTICALVNLGGQYERKVPKLGYSKWKDVKHLYPELKNYWEMTDEDFVNWGKIIKENRENEGN